jgi:hypothetical protein
VWRRGTCICVSSPLQALHARTAVISNPAAGSEMVLMGTIRASFACHGVGQELSSRCCACQAEHAMAPDGPCLIRDPAAKDPAHTTASECDGGTHACRAYRVFNWPHPPLQQDSILFATLMDVVSDTGDVDATLQCADVHLCPDSVQHAKEHWRAEGCCWQEATSGQHAVAHPQHPLPRCRV